MVRCCVVFAWNVGFDKVELYHVITDIPECRWYYLSLEESRVRFFVCKDNIIIIG